MKPAKIIYATSLILIAIAIAIKIDRNIVLYLLDYFQYNYDFLILEYIDHILLFVGISMLLLWQLFQLFDKKPYHKSDEVVK